MARSRLSQVDLNLLVPLEALLREMNVTRAAAQLGVTQSALSHTLNRLRAHFDDPLLVRRGSEMTKTVLAEQLGPDLSVALESAERLLSARARFEPATAAHRFAIIGADYAQIVVIEPLLEQLRKTAPSLDVILRTVRDPERALSAREYALMVGPRRAEPESLRRQVLFEDRLVCLGRLDHSGLQARLDLKSYLSLSHILVSPRGLPGGIVDDTLAQAGVERRVVLDVPSFLSAAFIAAGSDRVVTMPQRLAKRLTDRLHVMTAELPFRTPPIEFVQLWHERHQHDPAHSWLRAQIAALSAD